MWPFEGLVAALSAPFRNVLARNTGMVPSDDFAARHDGDDGDSATPLASSLDCQVEDYPFVEFPLPGIFEDGHGVDDECHNNNDDDDGAAALATSLDHQVEDCPFVEFPLPEIFADKHGVDDEHDSNGDDDTDTGANVNTDTDTHAAADMDDDNKILFTMSHTSDFAIITLGPAATPLFIAPSIFTSSSPAFARTLAHISTLTLSPAILLESIPAAHFGTLLHWLQTLVPPSFPRPTDFLPLLRLWVSTARLGLWQKANTLLRLGMVTMMDEDAGCDFDAVRWVFANTASSSPLRGYVVAVFAQRGAVDHALVAEGETGDAEIWKAITGFMGELEGARRVFSRWEMAREGKLAWGVDGVGGLVFDHEVLLERAREKQARGGVEEEVKMRLPEYLVWDEMAVDVPDRFFLFPGTLAYEEGLDEKLRIKV